ncbi:MAG: GTP-binding protein [Clostridia bacterium]|nr:GTP-binding protein [Clostridia bacterium]
MTRIDIFSGFLGAGKTTLIKKLIEEAYKGEKIVLIENEFGEIGIDGGFLAEAGIQINEMNSGCICCSLVGDFAAALQKVIAEYAPDRILIEPSGVGKLSDVIKAVKSADTEGAVLGGFTTVVDANKCKMHMKNFGEFFNDQVESAGCIVLSHTGKISDAKIAECIELLRAHNENAVIVSTPWNMLSGTQMLEAMERKSTLEGELEKLEKEAHEHHHEHHHHDGECCHHDHEHHHHDGECCHHDHEHHHHDGECCHHDHEHHHHDGECCHHDHEHHHHDGECCHHDHEHHHHDGECCHHDHEHHHEYDEHGNCSCGHHHEHGEHHHHHADEVFVSFGVETTKKFNLDILKSVLDSFTDTEKYGVVLRAKGIVEGDSGEWIHFDYIPGESDLRYGGAGIIGRLCVIGSKLNKEALEEALGVTLA